MGEQMMVFSDHLLNDNSVKNYESDLMLVHDDNVGNAVLLNHGHFPYLGGILKISQGGVTKKTLLNLHE